MFEREYGIGIIGNGHYVPKNVVTNEMIEAWTGVPAANIEAKIGIKTRFVVDDDESASSMSYKAAQLAISKSGIDVKEIGLIIVCSFTGDYVFPAMACKVQDLIGATNAGALRLNGELHKLSGGIVSCIGPHEG